MRKITTLLVLTASANAAWIECDELGGELVEMPRFAESALVSIGDEVVLVAVPEAEIKGAMSADEFCKEFDGEVAFVLPIPKPAVDDSLAPEIPTLSTSSGDVDHPTSPGFRTHRVTVPEGPRPGEEGAAPPDEEEPAPLPADISEVEDPAPDLGLGGCSTSGRGPSPWALGLLLLVLRRREGGCA